MSGSLSKAHALIHAGSYDSAIDELKSVLASQPDHAYAQALLAACFLDKGFPSDALKEAEAALAHEPDMAFAHRVVGLAQLRRKDFVLAEAAIRRAIELAPEDADNHRALGVMFESGARLGEARAAFEEALRLDPTDSATVASYADFLIDKGEIDEAERFIADAPDDLADNVQMLIIRGKIAPAEGDLDTARDLALWALRHDAQNGAAINLLCETKIRQNPLMGVWWRWAMFMQRFDGKTRVFILIGSWLAYNLAARTVLRAAPPAVSAGAAILWVGFCLLTWIGPYIQARMINAELKKVSLRPEF